MPPELSFSAQAAAALARYPEFFVAAVVVTMFGLVLQRRKGERKATNHSTPMFNRVINFTFVIIVLLIVSGSVRTIVWGLTKDSCQQETHASKR